MSFSRVKPAGWTDNVDTVTASQLNTLDTNVSNSVDGRGGTYTLSSTLEFNGTFGVKLAGSGSAARLQYGSRSITRHFAFNATTTSGNWARTTTPRGSWHNTATGGTLDIALESLPNGAVLDSLALLWAGAAGHAAFPGGAPTMPNINLFRINDDGTETSIANVSDTTATAGGYETAHYITLSSIAHTIDRTLYRYVLVVTGETGANFIANAKAMKLKGTCTIADQSEW